MSLDPDLASSEYEFLHSGISLPRIELLRLPDLKGLRVLHLMCGDGLLCGFAHFSGASRVLGTDPSAGCITQAQASYPDCEFRQQALQQLPDEHFDVIVLSSLHHASGKKQFIQQLMQRLSSSGVLVLEQGIAAGRRRWSTLNIAGQAFRFPSQKGLETLLRPYAWKLQGTGFIRSSDPVRRFVVHVQNLRPYAYLLLQPPGFGKTTLARQAFSPSRAVLISGDLLYSKVARGRLQAPEALSALICARYQEYQFAGETKRQYDWADVTQRIISAGLLPELVDFWLAEHGVTDCVIDSFIPAEHHQTVQELLQQRGFVAVLMHWQVEQTQLNVADGREQLLQFQQTRQGMSPTPRLKLLQRLLQRLKLKS
ncbi:class I SAM-dependent methyltransferase [Alkalimonas amylolytica]|uniref:2-polyprenyl-3-methyl-5-hydroxy-6-metoxy-1,4-benzoquinol methylase n=1 Tax=Alkalimonas amylolytica TaxID=152573 RepID=A0A1H3ZZQ7_ALKAM|nr:class I SAM-dependent methyltransferase [Alkalimonas amylolytica]SEA29185.1 2-polyprenyl-3-methyl-5-hydroxy-6-metoxy-1,4-benzoquinol methylase [Alkalimonas amylolytica]